MRFAPLTRRSVVIAASIATLAAACGGTETTVIENDEPPAEPPTASLVDRTFWSVEVTVRGTAFPLVDGTRVQLAFGPDEVSADAGCNSMFATYALDGDTILAQGGAMTEMGCDPERHAQDDFVMGFITDSPTYQLIDDTLRLANAEGDTIVLVDREVADPDRTIDGQAWEVTGFFDELAAWSTAVDTPAVIDFAAGTIAGPNGCSAVLPVIPFDDERAAFLVPESELVTWCAEATGTDAEYAMDLERVLAIGELLVEIDGPHLRLTAPNGSGLTATAVE